MKTIAQKLCPKSLIVVSGQPKEVGKSNPFVSSVPPTLDILSESYGEESVFYPAQHICLYGETQLVALRDFIDKLLSGETDCLTPPPVAVDAGK